LRAATATSTEPGVPLFDLRLEAEDLEAVATALRAGPLAMGARTAAFERAFAAQLGCAHAVALSSATAALHLAYLAAGVGPGDEVVVPAYTFVATANAALYCGATPVFADVVGEHDLGIDPAAVERALTPRTKAVAAVHFGGYAAAVDVLAELCAARGIALIEDAAHTPSATLGGRKLGTFGLAGAFSFFSNKVLSVGEGGLLATDSDEVAALARSLRSPAAGAGLNYRLDEPRAALLGSRLPRLEDDIARRRELVLEYRRRLAGLDGVTLPYRDEDVATSSCYVMPIMLARPERRPELRRFLSARGIQTSILYPAIHEFTAYRERFPGVSLPRTEAAARAELTIPLFPHMTAAQQDRVLAALEEGLAP